MALLGAPNSYLSDGLHLSDAGNEFVFECLMATVKASFPDLAADDGNDYPGGLPPDAPWHAAIDFRDPEASFAAHAAQCSGD